MSNRHSAARPVVAVIGAGLALVAAAAVLALGGTTPATAAPEDYADGVGPGLADAAPDQLPPPVSAKGLEVIGHHDLNQARGNTSDVWYLNGTAFLGYRCSEDKGSSVVDVSDPANPRLLFQTDVMSRTFANDVKALHMETAFFTGDVLVEGHDRCRAAGPPAQTRLWDVSDPAAPQLLGAIVTGDGVHDVYAFQRGDNAFVLLAAPFADTADNTSVGYEDVDLDADFAIADITDPRNPVVVGKYNLRQSLGRLPGSVFLHDVSANAAGTRAYAAWWDAGMILLDISDVTAPQLVSRLSYLDQGAGNTHAAVPAKNEDYVVITDEDFGPTDGLFEVLTPPAIAGAKASNAGNFANMLIGQPLMEGDLVWVGRGCQVDAAYPGITTDDPYLHDATGKIAVIVRGDCSFANKILRAQKEGATAAVIVNHTPGSGPPPMGGGDGAITIPGTGIAYEDGNAITTTLEGGVDVRARFGVVAGEWGFTRLADYTDPANPKLVGEYTIPETRQYPPAPGSFSVHNPWVVGDTLYLSHYYAGVRVVDIADPANPVELAYLVPGGRPLKGGGEAHSNIWGVITDENGLIYLSDITSGLWIIGEKAPAQQPTPTTVPTSVPPPPPTPTAVPTPGGGSVCRQIQGRVPAAAIQAAMANPARVSGYRQPMDPAKPVSPFNPRRLMLSLRTYGKPYHPVFNGLVFKVGCP